MGLMIFGVIMSILIFIGFKYIDDNTSDLLMGFAELIKLLFAIIMFFVTLLGTIIYMFI